MSGSQSCRARAQSTLVGVALLVGLAVVSLGVLTAAIGAVVEDSAGTADARRVAGDLEAALAPVQATGPRRSRVSFTAGRLGTVERDLRVLDESGVVRRVAVDGLVYESDGRRVAAVAGAIIRGPPGNAVMVEPPPITASRGEGGVLVVGAPRLNGSGAAAGRDVSVVIRTDVRHTRTALGEGSYRVAIETRTPGAVERYFTARGATVDRRDIDGDGVASVIARFPGDREGYLVVHDLDLEVIGG